MNSMMHNRSVLILTQQTIKVGARGLQNTKSFALLMISAVLAGTFCLSPAISSLISSINIESSGQISTNLPTITAASGYWQDIQTAVDWVVARGGAGRVYIPEGTFDFVNIGESWTGTRVTIPAGVSLFGAPTERTSGLTYDGRGMNPNDQVIEWKTILRLPWDVPGSWLGSSDPDPPPEGSAPKVPNMFRFYGSGNPAEHSRFSDIKLVGYRSVDPNSVMIIKGLSVINVAGFRIDHVYLEHIPAGVSTFGASNNGVIDHSHFVNPIGVTGENPEWYDNTVGYGIQMDRSWGLGMSYWEDDVSKVLGQDTGYTIFIEDCFFRNWRHITCGGNGAHYVFRHNTNQGGFGYADIDAHGRAAVNEEGQFTQVGTRAVEIYNNLIVDATVWGWGTGIRGGAGVSFNNTFGGGTFQYLMYLRNDMYNTPAVSKVWVNDWWIWDNTLLAGSRLLTKADYSGQIIEGQNYYFYSPHTFDYNPFLYPHPLTLEEMV